MKLHRYIALGLLLVVGIILADAGPSLYREYKQRSLFDPAHFNVQAPAGEDPVKTAIRKRLGCVASGVFSRSECLREYRSTINSLLSANYTINTETAMFYSALDKCPQVFRRCLRNSLDVDECMETERGCVATVRQLFWIDKNGRSGGQAPTEE